MVTTRKPLPNECQGVFFFCSNLYIHTTPYTQCLFLCKTKTNGQNCPSSWTSRASIPMRTVQQVSRYFFDEK